MTFEEIISSIKSSFDPTTILNEQHEAKQPFIEVAPAHVFQICEFLYKDKDLLFDYLSCITVVDNGPDKGTLEVIYHLSSLPYEHDFIIKIIVDRKIEDEVHPEVPSVCSIWQSADWHEREAYDLFGIKFTDHPDMRRILLPHNWEGYPLRKDYEEQTYYHGIKVKY